MNWGTRNRLLFLGPASKIGQAKKMKDQNSGLSSAINQPFVTLTLAVHLVHPRFQG